MSDKLIIYQCFPRILTNDCDHPVSNGSYLQNGSGKLNDITAEVLRSIKELGVNCIWYTGILEHATKTEFPGILADCATIVKGEAGSPYAVKDYYDVAPSLATDTQNRIPEFEQLIERTHRAGMKAIMDFVPNHTARQYHSDAAPKGIEDFGKSDDITKCFTPDNNYYYITNQRFAPDFNIGQYVEFPAKATGNDAFTAFPNEYDWYETVKLNYGYDYGDRSQHFDPVPSTWNKMLHILRYWASKNIDGFRCDMASMVPIEFWHWVIPQVKKDYPQLIFIGEIYDVSQYRKFLDYGYFDYIYDKVNLYDTLVAIETSQHSAARLTGCWQTVDGIAPRMLNFLENHDEVRFGSEAYAGDPAKVVPSLVVSAMMNRSPFMIYYGQELGERATDNEGFAGNNHRTTIFDYWSLDTLRRWYNHGNPGMALLTQKEIWLRNIYKRVLTLCNSEKAVSEGSFFDLMYVNLNNRAFDPHRHFTFLRHHEDVTLLIAVNFSDCNADMKINIPRAAFEMMELPVGNCMATELLSDKSKPFSLSIGNPVRITVPAHYAVVWKFRHTDFTPTN